MLAYYSRSGVRCSLLRCSLFVDWHRRAIKKATGTLMAVDYTDTESKPAYMANVMVNAADAIDVIRRVVASQLCDDAMVSTIVDALYYTVNSNRSSIMEHALIALDELCKFCNLEKSTGTGSIGVFAFLVRHRTTF